MSAPPATITYPSTNGVAHTGSYTYNPADGQLASATDQNGKVTSYFYGENGDLLDRLTGINYPDCVAQGVCNSTTHSVSNTYSNACGQPSSTGFLIQSGSSRTETATLDGVCHVMRKTITSDSQPDYVDTTYDGLGRAKTVSNPYRSTSDPSYGLTTYAYDVLGRSADVDATHHAIQNPDGTYTSG